MLSPAFVVPLRFISHLWHSFLVYCGFLACIWFVLISSHLSFQLGVAISAAILCQRCFIIHNLKTRRSCIFSEVLHTLSCSWSQQAEPKLFRSLCNCMAICSRLGCPQGFVSGQTLRMLYITLHLVKHIIYPNATPTLKGGWVLLDCAGWSVWVEKLCVCNLRSTC